MNFYFWSSEQSFSTTNKSFQSSVSWIRTRIKKAAGSGIRIRTGIEKNSWDPDQQKRYADPQPWIILDSGTHFSHE